jgi:hypothetical protein
MDQSRWFYVVAQTLFGHFRTVVVPVVLIDRKAALWTEVGAIVGEAPWRSEGNTAECLCGKAGQRRERAVSYVSSCFPIGWAFA